MVDTKVINAFCFPVSNSVPPIRTYPIRGLKASQSYSIKVTAVNSAGHTAAVYDIQTTDNSDLGKSNWIFLAFSDGSGK